MTPDGSTRCVSCGGVWHPASGDWNPALEVATCGRCVRAFWGWFKGHSNAKREYVIRATRTAEDIAKKRKGRVKAKVSIGFYEAAATSIRAA